MRYLTIKNKNMTYLKQLEEEKKIREAQERDAERLKQCVVELESLTSKFDGEFLGALEELINKFKE